MEEEKKKSPVVRAVMPGIILALILICAAFAAFMYVLPAQSEGHGNLSYNYVSDTAKNSSVDFAVDASTEDTILLFDSSQLATTAATIPQVPLNTLGGNSYGFDVTYVGEAFDQGLWHAIAAAAYEPKVKNKKCAIIIAPTVFEDGGMDNETFGMRFSYSLYRAFCDNPKVSKESKGYATRRLAEYGIDDTTINAGLRQMPQDYLNDFVYALTDDIKLRSDLIKTRTKGTDLTKRSKEAPSFDDLRVQALVDAQAGSTNDWGMDDTFYAAHVEGKMDSLKNVYADQTFSKTKEYDDFTFFLQVCKEVGMEPLVIMGPVHGDFYDYAGVSKETREYSYQRVRDICEMMDVELADFSAHEYDKYYLLDIVHFGWTGWLDVEEALVNYVNGK